MSHETSGQAGRVGEQEATLAAWAPAHLRAPSHPDALLCVTRLFAGMPPTAGVRASADSEVGAQPSAAGQAGSNLACPAQGCSSHSRSTEKNAESQRSHTVTGGRSETRRGSAMPDAALLMSHQMSAPREDVLHYPCQVKSLRRCWTSQWRPPVRTPTSHSGALSSISGSSLQLPANADL